MHIYTLQLRIIWRQVTNVSYFLADPAYVHLPVFNEHSDMTDLFSICALGILSNILDWCTYQCNKSADEIGEPGTDLYELQDINAIPHSVCKSYRYIRGMSYHLLSWFFTTHKFTESVPDTSTLMSHMKPVTGPYRSIFIANFGRILKTITVYAQNTIVPNGLWCAEEIDHQILSLVGRETGLYNRYIHQYADNDLSLSWNLWDYCVHPAAEKKFNGTCIWAPSRYSIPNQPIAATRLDHFAQGTSNFDILFFDLDDNRSESSNGDTENEDSCSNNSTKELPVDSDYQAKQAHQETTVQNRSKVFPKSSSDNESDSESSEPTLKIPPRSIKRKHAVHSTPSGSSDSAKGQPEQSLGRKRQKGKKKQKLLKH